MRSSLMRKTARPPQSGQVPNQTGAEVLGSRLACSLMRNVPSVPDDDEAVGHLESGMTVKRVRYAHRVLVVRTGALAA